MTVQKLPATSIPKGWKCCCRQATVKKWKIKSEFRLLDRDMRLRGATKTFVMT